MAGTQDGSPKANGHSWISLMGAAVLSEANDIKRPIDSLAAELGME
eukprot:CAMPEP_0170622916 /NCGR_PEP_ID=MMETSP0224-20130122/29396_1 /TAXON_ID=285029 /ORGANISM="Togula jolla, Strain CCCM 725" /LENGTH=45 /DNA_ID= /DNA_START= /DNA_END= /DNA_ORIENTATION=